MKRAMRAADVPDDLTKVRYPIYGSTKIDGIGCVVIEGVALSRKMKKIPNRYIQECLRLLPTGMHGELAPRNPNGANTWNKAQSGVMSRDGEPDFVFHIFDWMSAMPYHLRYAALKKWHLRNPNPRVRIVAHDLLHNAKQVEQFYKDCLKQGYEGAMLRAPDSPYKQGRSTTREGYLMKLKPIQDIEATIVGFIEEMENQNEQTVAEDGRSKRAKKKEFMKPKGTLGSLELKLANGKTFNCGSGISESLAERIWANQKKYMGRTVTITFTEWTINGKPRNPRWKGWRHD